MNKPVKCGCGGKADNFMLPEEQAKYIQQTIWTILTNPNPSILDIALLPILVTDSRNGFSEEMRKELMDEFIRFTGTQNNQDLLSEQMKQINMSHASMQECAKNARCNERTAKVEVVEKPNVYKCSECGQYFHSTAWGSPVEYCSRCGAKLDWGMKTSRWNI